MRVLSLLFGGAVGALIGVLLWAGVVYFTGYEVGIVAAFLGVFVGVGVSAAAGPNRGPGTAVLAGVLALLAVMAGKASVAWVYTQQFLAEEAMTSADITDEFLISCIADDVVAEYQWEGWALDYPAGADMEFPDSEADYPAEVWAEAEDRWFTMPADQQQDYRASIEFGADALPIAAFVLAFLFSFGLFDLLWIGIAVSSAYQIVNNKGDHDAAPTGATAGSPAAQPQEAAAPMFLPGLPPPTGEPGTVHGQPNAPRAAEAGDPGTEDPGRREAG